MPAPAPVPFTRPIAEALGASDPLGRLMARLRESEARFVTVGRALPAALAPHVRAGVLDESGWNLLAANGAVAAKLRQLLPSIEQALLDQGWQRTPIRIKVQSGSR